MRDRFPHFENDALMIKSKHPKPSTRNRNLGAHGAGAGHGLAVCKRGLQQPILLSVKVLPLRADTKVSG